jgi:hypothetical protein
LPPPKAGFTPGSDNVWQAVKHIVSHSCSNCHQLRQGLADCEANCQPFIFLLDPIGKVSGNVWQALNVQTDIVPS